MTDTDFEEKYVNKILQGNALDVLPTLPDEHFSCVVTSPPYWSLRSYGTEPQVWGGNKNCRHEWGKYVATLNNENRQGKSTGIIKSQNALHGKGDSPAAFCSLCGAWKGELGLEPTIELFIEHLVSIFDALKPKLRKDGQLFVNLGDSYGSGASGQNFKKEYGSTANGGKNYETIKKKATVGFQKSCCLVPERFAIAMVDSDSDDIYELREDLSEKDKKYVLTELSKRGIFYEKD